MFLLTSFKFRLAGLLKSPALEFKRRKAVHILMLLGTLMLPQQYALADLMLHPTRVVMEKNQRAAQVELINNDSEPATYRISLVNRRMNEIGEFSTADTAAPGEQFADNLLRYSPRQVTLAPGVSQVVRIMLRKPSGLAPGEYRSHLQFDKVPDASGATSIETRQPEDKDIGITLTALVGVSIPVIVRHGDTAASVNMSHVELQKATAGQSPVLSLQLNRSGNRSVYGDLTVTFTPQGGDEQLIAKAGGVAVYTPNLSRRAKMLLRLPSAVSLTQGTIRVTYRERPEAGGALLAEAAMQLP